VTTRTAILRLLQDDLRVARLFSYFDSRRTRRRISWQLMNQLSTLPRLLLATLEPRSASPDAALPYGVPSSAAVPLVFRLNSSNFAKNGELLVLIADSPTLSLLGQTVSMGLSCFQVAPSVEMAPRIRLPWRSRRR
jgi:hypothetical protein